jgi:hypothetical protein
VMIVGLSKAVVQMDLQLMAVRRFENRRRIVARLVPSLCAIVVEDIRCFLKIQGGTLHSFVPEVEG